MSSLSPTQIGHVAEGEEIYAAPPLFQADPAEVLGLNTEARQEVWRDHQRQFDSAAATMSRDCRERDSRRESKLSFKDCESAIISERETCPLCRREIVAYATFCPHCGTNLKAGSSTLASARVEQEVAACVGPSAAPQHRRFAGRAASKVRNFAGKAVAPLRSAASIVSNGATTLPAHLSFRVVIFFAIFFAGCVVLVDFIFPELVSGAAATADNKVTASDTSYGETGESSSAMSPLPAIIFTSLFLPTAIYLVYRRQALMQRISKLKRLLPASRRRIKYSTLADCSIDRPTEDGFCSESISRADSFESDGFESCAESAWSAGDENEEASFAMTRGHKGQLPLLDWLLPAIRDPLIALWSSDERRKIREMAAFLTSSETSKAVRATVTAFGNPDVCAWRFLRSSWDVEIAKQRLKDTAAWRADVLAGRCGVNGVPAFQVAGGCELRAPSTEASRKIFLCNRQLFPAVGWDGGAYDRTRPEGGSRWWNAHDGSPVELWLLGQVDAHEICSRFTQDELVDCYMEYNERRRERVNACRAAGFLVVFDASGMGFSHLRKGLKYAWRASAVMEMGEKHYPGSIRRVFVTNAPSFVHAGYMAVQPVLGAATRNSVTITAKPAEEVEELTNLLPQGMLQEMRASLA